MSTWESIDEPPIPGIILEVNLYGKKLTVLPKWISKCHQLLKLTCSENKLTQLPDTLPASLQVLECYNNELTQLPDTQIMNKVSNPLPTSLRRLNCSGNELTKLPDTLPTLLQVLFCSYNKLTQLPDTLPILLQVLFCSYNKLTQLPDTLPTSLQILICDGNQLTKLPIYIINCRNLTEICYDNNLMGYIPPAIYRFLNRQKSKKINVYNDSQSVHNHNIQESIRTSILNVMNDPTKVDWNQVQAEIVSDHTLTDTCKRALLEYSDDQTEHSLLFITYKELLINVWNRINKHSNGAEIKIILNVEIKDGLCKCYTRRLSRLVNCLNGFYDDITVRIGTNEQIGNIIIVTKDELDKIGTYNVMDHRKLVRERLVEMEYGDDVIEEWLSFIDE